MECEVCCRPFDWDAHLPRNLRCGHTFCTACLDILFRSKQVRCPKCRFCQRASEVKSLPVSHGLVRLLEMTKLEGKKALFSTTPQNLFVFPAASQSNPQSEGSVISTNEVDYILRALRTHEATLRLLEKMAGSRKKNMESLWRERGIAWQDQGLLIQKRNYLTQCKEKLERADTLHDFELPDFCASSLSRTTDEYTDRYLLLQAALKANAENANALHKCAYLEKRQARRLRKMLPHIRHAPDGPEVDVDISGLFEDQML